MPYDFIREDACQDVKGLNLKVSSMKSYPKTNGMLCQGRVLQLPNDKLFGIDLVLGGKDLSKIIEAEQEELKNLQKQNINASIMQSQAANATKWATIILVIVTAFYVIIMYLTYREDKKSRQKLINDEMIMQ